MKCVLLFFCSCVKLCEDMVNALEITGAMLCLEAKNPKTDDDRKASTNPWVRFYLAMYGENGCAKDFKPLMSKSRVSDLKRKVTNDLIPYFEEHIITKKTSNNLTVTEVRFRNVIRQYKKLEQEKQEAKDRHATLKENMETVEAFMGAGKSLTRSVNTSLKLNPSMAAAQPGAHSSAVAAHGSPAADSSSMESTRRTYPSFDSIFQTPMMMNMTNAMIQSLGSSGDTDNVSSQDRTRTVTPAAIDRSSGPPAAKKPKISSQFRFMRKLIDNKTTPPIDITTFDAHETFKRLCKRVARLPNEKVMHISHDESRALKSKEKLDMVTIGGSWTEPYESIKAYTVEQILEILVTPRNPITVAFETVSASKETAGSSSESVIVGESD